MFIFKRFATALLLVLGLQGCVNEPVQMTDVHTGITASASKRYPIYQNLLVSVYGQAFVATKHGEVRRGVYVYQIATGTGWSFYKEAYSFGTKLDYTRGGSKVLGCSSVGCTNEEEGAVQLSAAQFAQAAKTGLEMELIGSGNSVVVRIPAAAFQEAQAMATGS